MSDDDVDRLLVDAGERWRAAQRPARSIDPALFAQGPGGAPRGWRLIATPLALAAVIVAVVASFAFGRWSVSGPTVGTGPAASPSASPSPSVAAAPSASVRPSPSTPSAAACDVTRPNPVFVPPKPFLRTPPTNYASDWYGSEHLWTMLAYSGEIWQGWVASKPPVLPQKTFWWSADWKPGDEPEPTIIVTGRRLDGPGDFTYGPGTNASADFGTAMLVGIDIPSYGCWELTARYRLATLSYVVSVGP
jgi:hypothetical protein